MTDRTRIAAAVILALVAAFFLLIAVSLPFQLERQSRQDRILYGQFRSAAAYTATYMDRHGGQLPPDMALQGLGDKSDAGGIWTSLSASGGDCVGDFQRSPTDKFTLWYWRGEWGECYSYPSARTTLSMSVSSYLRSGLGVQWAAWWLIGLAATFGALKCFRRREFV